MNSWRKVGIASRDSAPSDESSVGTLRQPSTAGPRPRRSSPPPRSRRGVFGRLRQERDAGGIAARVGQVEVDDRAQELVGDLDQDACTVAAVRLGALRHRGARG